MTAELTKEELARRGYVLTSVNPSQSAVEEACDVLDQMGVSSSYPFREIVRKVYKSMLESSSRAAPSSYVVSVIHALIPRIRSRRQAGFWLSAVEYRNNKLDQALVDRVLTTVQDLLRWLANKPERLDISAPPAKNPVWMNIDSRSVYDEIDVAECVCVSPVEAGDRLRIIVSRKTGKAYCHPVREFDGDEKFVKLHEE